MRMLALGVTMPNPSIEHYNFLTAPSFFDYDAVVCDPESITAIAREFVDEGASFEAFDGRMVVNGQTTSTGVSAADQLRRRRDETQRLLEHGATVLVLARPNATYHGIVGFEGCDRYWWLPAPEGASWGPPLLRQAEGSAVRIREDDHPVAAVLREFRQHAAYRAVFDDRQPAVRAGARVIAVGGTDLPIAVEFRVLGGRVIFLPAIELAMQASRMTLGEHLLTAVSRLHGEVTATEGPAWSRALALPGLEQLEAEAEEASAEEAAAATKLADVRAKVDVLRAYRALLWAEGRLFDDAVRASLEALGFALTSAAGEPLAVSADGTTAFVEAESGREEVTEWPYVRLQRRLEPQVFSTGTAPAGIVIANGRREESPDNRDRQFTAALENACGSYGYALITGETLFALTQRALGGASYEELEGMRRRLLRSRGLLGREAALGETPETEGGTIF